MFTRYKGFEIPKDYSGSRFKGEGLKTEMKTHKASPSYTSTRTSVSPTFKNAINLYDNQSNQKTSDYVYEIEPKDDFFASQDPDYLQDRSRRLHGQENNQSQDEENDNSLGGIEGEGEDKERDYYEENKSEYYEENKGTAENEGAKKGIGAILDEIKPIASKLFSSISSEDLLLISLALLFASEDSEEARGAILPLLLLFLYH